MQRKNKISFEGFNLNNQPTCCFFSNSISEKQSIKFNKKPQKYYIHNPQKKTEKINQQILDDQIKSRRATVSTLKKSLSGINLKRKNSQNQKTNRTFYQRSEISENYNKRFITTSMDAQIFKNYFPNSYTQQRNRSAFLSPSQGYNQLNKSKQSLESLLIKNQKRKKEQNIQKTIKNSNNNCSYKINQISSTKATNALLQKKNEPLLKKQNQNQIQHKIPAFLKQLKQKKQFKDQKQKQKFNQGAKLLNMNQIQSILINVTTQDKKYQNNSSLSIKKFNKQLLQNKTVSSQYQPDEEEVKQRVQQSAILVNYFNPPSFIKQKFNSTIAKSNVGKQFSNVQDEKKKKI